MTPPALLKSIVPNIRSALRPNHLSRLGGIFFSGRHMRVRAQIFIACASAMVAISAPVHAGGLKVCNRASVAATIAYADGVTNVQLSGVHTTDIGVWGWETVAPGTCYLHDFGAASAFTTDGKPLHVEYVYAKEPTGHWVPAADTRPVTDWAGTVWPVLRQLCVPVSQANALKDDPGMACDRLPFVVVQSHEGDWWDFELAP